MVWRVGSKDLLLLLSFDVLAAIGMKGTPAPLFLGEEEEGMGIGVCVGGVIEEELIIMGEGLGLVDCDLGLSIALGLDDPDCECCPGMSECRCAYDWFNWGD
jgi:hypothetical protein